MQILHTSAAMIALTVASPTVTVAHLKVRALYRRRTNKYGAYKPVPVIDIPVLVSTISKKTHQ